MDLLHIIDEVRKLMSGYTDVSNAEEFEDYQIADWKSAVDTHLDNNGIICDDPRYKSRVDLLERLYIECRRFGVVTKYMDDPDVEEIQINRWNDVKIKWSYSNEPERVESFLSPTNAFNIVSKMMEKNKAPWDVNNPIKTASIGKNTRVTGIAFDLIDPDVGVFATIRKINQKNLKSDDVIGSTLNQEMWNALYIFIKYGLSMLIAGETGSGKTTTCDILLKGAIPDWKRWHSFEQEIREIDPYKYIGDINSPNCVFLNNAVCFRTRPDKYDEARNVDFIRLLEADLTSNPDVQFIGEMKNKEARVAVQFANTSHQVIATLHAEDAESIPDRIVDMAEIEGHAIERMEYNIAKGFPILCVQRNLGNICRRMVQIVEQEIIVENGRKVVHFRHLYSYTVDEYIRDPETSKITDVKGHFEKIQDVSDKLITKLRSKGCTQKELDLLLGINKEENKSFVYDETLKYS